uniref:Uncharacterized protein n=1 Tax=Amorphochlora amoebiformis TaxID=1561963 RepID=A0A0H5BQZ7_9EUKA|nr:hypothetical protein [Amorphochlora amoebiformis]
MQLDNRIDSTIIQFLTIRSRGNSFLIKLLRIVSYKEYELSISYEELNHYRLKKLFFLFRNYPLLFIKKMKNCVISYIMKMKLRLRRLFYFFNINLHINISLINKNDFFHIHVSPISLKIGKISIIAGKINNIRTNSTPISTYIKEFDFTQRIKNPKIHYSSIDFPLEEYIITNLIIQSNKCKDRLFDTIDVLFKLPTKYQIFSKDDIIILGIPALNIIHGKNKVNLITKMKIIGLNSYPLIKRIKKSNNGLRSYFNYLRFRDVKNSFSIILDLFFKHTFNCDKINSLFLMLLLDINIIINRITLFKRSIHVLLELTKINLTSNILFYSTFKENLFFYIDFISEDAHKPSSYFNFWGGRLFLCSRRLILISFDMLENNNALRLILNAIEHAVLIVKSKYSRLNIRNSNDIIILLDPITKASLGYSTFVNESNPLNGELKLDFIIDGKPNINSFKHVKSDYLNIIKNIFSFSNYLFINENNDSLIKNQYKSKCKILEFSPQILKLYFHFVESQPHYLLFSKKALLILKLILLKSRKSSGNHINENTTMKSYSTSLQYLEVLIRVISSISALKMVNKIDSYLLVLGIIQYFNLKTNG